MGRKRPDGGPGRSGGRKESVIEETWRVPGSSDLLFPKWPRDIFNAILNEENLRTDRDGRRRTAHSLHHTYICLRLLEGANIYQIAQELSDKRSDDREILRSPFEDTTRCRRYQRHEATFEEKDDFRE